jgi:hypothetical protein
MLALAVGRVTEATSFEATLRERAVSIDEQELDIADLVVLGVLSGDWLEFEARVAWGLELERRHGDEVGAELVRHAATVFRYERGLISAREFTTWLTARNLKVAELAGCLRRSLLRQRFGPAPANIDLRGRAGVLRAEALFDGILVRLASAGVRLLVAGRREQLASSPGELPAQLPGNVDVARARRAAGIAALDEDELQARLGRLISLRGALERLRLEVGSPDALRRKLSEHGLDWLELSGPQLTFASEGAAREARLLFIEDRLSADAVAQRAGVPVITHSVYVSEFPHGIGVSFAGRVEGEVLGPWQDDQRWHVMRLDAKVAPSPENGELRAQAIEELLGELIERGAAGRVRSHCAL